MVDRQLIRALEDDSIESEIEKLFPGEAEDFGSLYRAQPEAEEQTYELNKIVSGKILRVDTDHVLIDIGFKSEASIPRSEWEEHETQPQVGDSIQVLIEDLEDETGMAEDQPGLIQISKRKADSILHWQRIISEVNEGDIITGTVTRKIKGGLLVDIGVPVFSPASQVDIRRPGDIADYIGRSVQCEVLKIDEQRRNIVVSRRSLIEKAPIRPAKITGRA